MRRLFSSFAVEVQIWWERYDWLAGTCGETEFWVKDNHCIGDRDRDRDKNDCCCYLYYSFLNNVVSCGKWYIDTQGVLLKFGLRFVKVLGAFTELRRATVGSVMCVCPSVRPHGTVRLPMDRFSWNLKLKYFWKTSRENSSFFNICQEYRVLYVNIYIYIYMCVYIYIFIYILREHNTHMVIMLYIYVCVCSRNIYIYIYLYIYTLYVNTHTYIYIYIYIYSVWTYMCVWVHV
jgi:hypothetical protein